MDADLHSSAISPEKTTSFSSLSALENAIEFEVLSVDCDVLLKVVAAAPALSATADLAFDLCKLRPNNSFHWALDLGISDIRREA
jgi:hypothetical protein